MYAQDLLEINALDARKLIVDSVAVENISRSGSDRGQASSYGCLRHLEDLERKEDLGKDLGGLQ